MYKTIVLSLIIAQSCLASSDMQDFDQPPVVKQWAQEASSVNVQYSSQVIALLIDSNTRVSDLKLELSELGSVQVPIYQQQMFPLCRNWLLLGLAQYQEKVLEDDEFVVQVMSTHNTSNLLMKVSEQVVHTTIDSDL